MTSNDRHSTIDSPYRTGRHVPLNQRGMGVLTSVATASESRADITINSYLEESGRMSPSALDGPSTAYGGSGASQSVPGSPANGRPYSPGLRSFTAKRASTADAFEIQNPSGEIPMQSFQGGHPPAPPLSHTWARIDKWAEDNYPELWDQLGEGCTTNDLNELEHYLDCSLPQEVRDSLQIHDGQERGGRPTGIIFSCMLLDCEEIVQEWDNWRKVNQDFLLETTVQKPSLPTRALGGSSSNGNGTAQAGSSKQAPSSPTSSSGQSWKQDLLDKQGSVPANAVLKAYAHPAWIPLVRDWGGNNLAVDLAPGPTGHWGQVILFGRDYDTKYVVARSWAHFLARFADDLNSGKWWIDEDSQDLKLREFKNARVEPGYFDILRWREDQKYARRAPRRRPAGPNGAASPTGSSSPYASPVDANGDTRGRSMQRLSANSPVASPIRLGHGKQSSPLARVAEEASVPLVQSTADGLLSPGENLVEVETPRPSDELNKAPRLAALENGEASEVNGSSSPLAVEKKPLTNGKQPALEDTDTMKTIEI
ncbi:cell wall assembly and cell proliferation coordinating protein [Coniochaeta ligniaria NRRL 30616]|uniref:Cell wall assembly and cell proliferation coordinating protein n=1 Tax=Coniochaeta ligniaria NRRL 30616 TaxID=1408157 RepID=A0A1J7J897_9PEZI|nr:cell wall assembly and cell proliferation coordinating protein [Coniochaeta ligniaria NRRL 30616]